VKVVSELLVRISVAVVGLVFVIPFVLMLLTSFRHSEYVVSDPLNPFAGGLTLDNYVYAWNQTPVLLYYANSIITTTLIVALQLVTSVAAAYALGHLRPWGTRALRTIVVVVLSIPVPAIAITNYLTLASWGLVDTRAGLIIPFAASAFGVFLLTQYVEAVPQQQLDAAAVYGLGPAARFRLVVLPSIRPGVAAFVAFSFVGWWNEFFWPFIALRSTDLATVPFLVRHFEVSPNALPDWGPLMAASTIALLPVALLLVLLQRSFARTMQFTAH
jgi:ABC-type glycerol-3-phosphate transport system permease component